MKSTGSRRDPRIHTLQNNRGWILWLATNNNARVSLTPHFLALIDYSIQKIIDLNRENILY
jgi:hypothetical protein